MKRYLEAALDADRILQEKQSVHWGDRPDGAECLVRSKISFKGFRTLGVPPRGPFTSFLFPETGVQPQPSCLDLQTWPVLELLFQVSGEASYQNRISSMANEFCRVGFDSLSGLPYLGEEVEFDVLRIAPTEAYGSKLYFKPDGNMPLKHLWAAAPEKMARMFHSLFYGLVQREETMDYNRFSEYGFDDSQKKPCRQFHSNHCATGYTAGHLVHWWGWFFARSGDKQVLTWAKAMTQKWKEVQHPVSGLIPAWFGGDAQDKDHMPPQPFSNNWDSDTAISFLLAAKEWESKPEGRDLAAELKTIGLRLISGLARYGYNPENRIFPQWINLDGTPRTKTTWYTFYSQEEKDEAAKSDPLLNEVTVFPGSGFYQAIRPWVLSAGNPLPYAIALAAKMTGDAWLLAKAEEFSSLIIHEARNLKGEFNAEEQWTLSANASYIKMLLLVHELTMNEKYLAWARELADIELKFLGEPLPPGKPQWWQMHFRNSWIEALLLLHKALHS